MKNLKSFIGALFVLLVTFGPPGAHAAEPLKIRIGWIAAPANLAPILFAKDESPNIWEKATPGPAAI